jgi:hypothetical protein
MDSIHIHHHVVSYKIEKFGPDANRLNDGRTHGRTGSNQQ